MNKILLIRNILENLNINPNIAITSMGEKADIVEVIDKTLEKYVLDNLDRFDLSHENIEGESKRVFKDNQSDICLIKLKPTLYSYTNNRYGVVKGTDILRNKLWKTFAKEINRESLNILLLGKGKYSIKIHNLMQKLIKTGKISRKYPFITSFLSQVEVDGEIYNVCKYIENQTPLEVVWKKYFLGTMKHNLLNVDKFETKYGSMVEIEGEIPEIVRFDWRNPFEFNGKRYKDECIPDDFADLWIDVQGAKILCLVVSNIIAEMVAKKGYEFVDTCYFVNMSGSIVYSEITPDGMRLKKKDQSFDKDLWRIGKSEEVICEAWNKLYEDLREL